MTPHSTFSFRFLVPFLLFGAIGCAATPQQKAFKSPQAAVDSLVDALRRQDRDRLKQVLGDAGVDLLASGDNVADKSDLSRFLAFYDTKHQLQDEADGASTLLVGADDWPFPVPIVKAKGGYVFDIEAGKDEVLNRRIGRNELAAQQVCLAIADAQREYVRLRPMGGDLPEYARKLVSDPGTKNGLYWPSGEGEEPSPLGELAAAAAEHGYGRSDRTDELPLRAYYGYRYRLLTRQGPHAPGGAIDYVVNGKLVGGFAVVAYPAKYGNSGIMTFITNHDGVVYQRDLGPETPRAAEGMSAFDPGPDWTKAADGSRTEVEAAAGR
jgi:hypothetical protein